jgi:mannose-6-phosphate isomerase-like protein (cupin superfamily)
MIVEQKRVEKPWGHEKIWSHCEKFVGKILCISQGHKLSRQYHEQKEETILVLTGTLLLEVGQGDELRQIDLKKGQSFHVTPGTIHRFCAPYGDVELAEVSTPELDDVVRLEDDYRR